MEGYWEGNFIPPSPEKMAWDNILFSQQQVKVRNFVSSLQSLRRDDVNAVPCGTREQQLASHFAAFSL